MPVLRAEQLASLACALPLFLCDNTCGFTDGDPALYLLCIAKNPQTLLHRLFVYPVAQLASCIKLPALRYISQQSYLPQALNGNCGEGCKRLLFTDDGCCQLCDIILVFPSTRAMVSRPQLVPAGAHIQLQTLQQVHAPVPPAHLAGSNASRRCMPCACSE